MEKAPKEVEDHKVFKEPLELRVPKEPKEKEDRKGTLEPRELRGLKGHKVTEVHKELKGQSEHKGQ